MTRKYDAPRVCVAVVQWQEIFVAISSWGSWEPPHPPPLSNSSEQGNWKSCDKPKSEDERQPAQISGRGASQVPINSNRVIIGPGRTAFNDGWRAQRLTVQYDAFGSCSLGLGNTPEPRRDYIPLRVYSQGNNISGSATALISSESSICMKAESNLQCK